MEGFLQKWVNYIYGWKKRYFILQDGVLMYCKEKGQRRKGAVHLNVAEILAHPKNPNRLIINTGCTILHLQADSKAVAQSWLVALRSAKQATAPPSATEGVEETAENPRVTQVLVRLSGIQGAFEEKLDALPAKYREDPMLRELVQLARDFKNSETAGTRHRSESPNRPRRKPERGLTEGNIREVLEESEDQLDFCDAKSHLSDAEMFYDAQEEAFAPRGLPVPYRKTLPFLRNPNQKINIWRVVKDSIGKELSKMAVPVYFNEPISFLQRFSEDLLYHDLLIRAATEQDAGMRIALIACFAVSGYSVTSHRHMKPFNPLLGETFELERDGFRLISEQVSHHPPVSALHCDHEQYSFWGQTEIKTSFKGTYLQVHPDGSLYVRLHPTQETYTWSKPNSTVHNIIFGKMYVDHHGEVVVRCLETGWECKVMMKKRGWFDKDPHRVEGVVLDDTGKEVVTIDGKWTEWLSTTDLATNTTTEVWRIRPFQEGFEYNYYFTDFTIQLNLPPDQLPGPLPGTDSRYRPDQRALEHGDLQTAGLEKNRVEEKQRVARKEREEQGEEWTPMWFRLEGEEWRYAGEYWERKESAAFQQLPDIF